MMHAISSKHCCRQCGRHWAAHLVGLQAALLWASPAAAPAAAASPALLPFAVACAVVLQRLYFAVASRCGAVGCWCPGPLTLLAAADGVVVVLVARDALVGVQVVSAGRGVLLCWPFGALASVGAVHQHCRRDGRWELECSRHA